MESKPCIKCGIIKPLSEFYVRKSTGNSVGECKECVISRTKAYRLQDPEKWKEYSTKYYMEHKDEHRAWCREWEKENKKDISAKRKLWESKNKHRRRGYELKSYYNLSAEAYNALLESQGNLCAICKIKPPTNVDHDHACCNGSKSCGKCVRGLLCRNCNNAIGFFKDSIPSLLSAVEYLSRRREI